jgi:hypothetical protein
MKYQCPHCHSNRFRLLTAAEGATLAQCLACGEPSSFTVSTMLDCSGRARLTETIPFRPDHRLNGRRRTSA